MILDESCKDALGQMKVTKVDDTSITLDGHVIIKLDEQNIEHILSLYKKKEYPQYVVPVMYNGNAYDITFVPDAPEWDRIMLCEYLDSPPEYFLITFDEPKNKIVIYETADVFGNEKDGYSANLTGHIVHETEVYTEDEL